MVNNPHHFSDDFARGLACAAITPGLRRMLLFDVSNDVFFDTASHMLAMLKTVTGHTFRTVTLGSAENEDDLWTKLELEQGSAGLQLSLKPGRLASNPAQPNPILVLIPDLARISLSAARACVALMGEAEVATLQRHGLNVFWNSNMCWIARCARAEVGEISPHLMDRFVLRFSAQAELSSDRAGDILAWINEPISESQPQGARLAPAFSAALLAAKELTPDFLMTAIAHVLARLGQQTAEGVRRELALARLSRALAQMDGAQEVTTSHVNTAATLIGLQHKAGLTDSPTPAPASLLNQTLPQKTGSHLGPAPDSGNIGGVATPSVLQEEASEESVLKSDTEATFDVAPVVSLPYPEDTIPIAREANSLQLPSNRRRISSAAEGPIIGTQPATNLSDMALVSTIMEAAKFQNVRPRDEKSQSFLIIRSDLRSYRRTPLPQQMLMLVLDYTCLNGCHWQEAVWPYLRWAYIVRAGISIVQVGLASPQRDNLRAELVSAHNLLSPRIREALDGRSGKATPLAHGLDIAMRTLRTALQHGRSRIQQAQLVVISDGRGNIPLSASRAGSLKQPVCREGIDDALKVARDLRSLKSLEIHFLNPQPQQYPELPLMLAEALGVAIENIPLKETL